MQNHRIISNFSSLVNPQCHIPGFITNLTGINDYMVRNSPTIDKVMPKFLDFLEDRPFVAHNAWFDYSFIDVNARKTMQKNISNDVICTVRLSRQLLPELPSKKLGCLCEHFNIKNNQAHRAMGDVLATSQVFSNLMNILEQKGLKTYDELFDAQFRGVKAIRSSD